MIFNSINFIFIFLPIFIIGNIFTPKRFKNLYLFLGSLVFYVVGVFKTPLDILLLLLSVAVNFFVSRLFSMYSMHRKKILVFGIAYNLLWLCVFKYSRFLLSNIFALFGKIYEGWTPLLPLGISFYTFSAISYIVDVYKRKTAPAKNIIDFGAYLTLFPKLISGPIATYDSVRDALNNRTVTLYSFFDGFRIFILGLGFKVLLSGPMGKLWGQLTMIGYESVSTTLAWLGLIAVGLQIYFDFYGYSLMALGLGKMIGIPIPENFKRPYMSKSLSEFWRRWHITLGAWFREYIYFPLGGSRVNKLRLIRNLLAVWLFTGLWHGADWNFVIWGLFFFLMLTMEKLLYKSFLEKHKIFARFYTIFFILISWAIFSINDLNMLGAFLTRLIPFFPPSSDAVVYAKDFVEPLRDHWYTLIIGIIASTGIIEGAYKKYKDNPLTALSLTAVFLGSIYLIYMGQSSSFLYFNF